MIPPDPSPNRHGPVWAVRGLVRSPMPAVPAGA
jgi:hypothetical protein